VWVVQPAGTAGLEPASETLAHEPMGTATANGTTANLSNLEITAPPMTLAMLDRFECGPEVKTDRRP
jgi:hypothetical protein